MRFVCWYPLTGLLATTLAVTAATEFVGGVAGETFDKYYNITFGEQHVQTSNGGDTIEFGMDNTTGSGFKSKVAYTSGSFEMWIKLPNIQDSKGVITAYFLTSAEKNGTEKKRTEVDMEFLGEKILQTNFYIDAVGEREQRLNLWFDPSADFHSYQIIWNPTFVAIYVDKIPIRYLKRSQTHHSFFTKPHNNSFLTKPQFVMGSMWNAPDWAGHVDWAKQPFKAQFNGPFQIEGCSKGSNSDCDQKSWWGKIHDLTPDQLARYKTYKKHVFYDYCTLKNKKPPVPNDCQ